MVKLIRLTSTDNATFESNLDSEIKLGANAQVALRNLTFESDFDVFSTDIGNNSVSTNFDNPDYNLIYAALENNDYTSSNYKELLLNLQGALNSTLKLSKATPSDGDVYSSYKVELDSNGKINILYQYSSLSLMFHFNEFIENGDNQNSRRDQRNGFDRRLMVSNRDIEEDDPYLTYKSEVTSETELIYTIGDVEASVNTQTEDFFQYMAPAQSDFFLCNGTATFMVNISNLIDHAGSDDSHGFGIGLSYTDLSQLQTDTELPNDSRDFEIIVQKTTSPYQFRSPTVPHVNQVGPISPHNFGVATKTSNDKMVFERSGGFIKAYIWNTMVNGGFTTLLYNYEIPLDKRSSPLYPYIYVKSGYSNCVVGRPIITFDSLFEANKEFDYIGETQTLGGRNLPLDPDNPEPRPYSNVYQTMDNFNNLVPTLDNQRFVIADISQNFLVTIHNDILRFLGFDKTQHYTNQGYTFKPFIGASLPVAFGFKIQAEDLFQVVNSDSYVVELLNIPLESFDASVPIKNSNTNRGKRRNILDVIPVNNNSGIVEYNANEALFIDINNSQPLNITNLSIRILNKDLKPVLIVGTSVITILFK
tara:strand:+ start:1783 stop:3552 length:1770 start_codon:yes stop_codon:yes gene_type:complete